MPLSRISCAILEMNTSLSIFNMARESINTIKYKCQKCMYVHTKSILTAEHMGCICGSKKTQLNRKQLNRNMSAE